MLRGRRKVYRKHAFLGTSDADRDSLRVEAVIHARPHQSNSEGVDGVGVPGLDCEVQKSEGVLRMPGKAQEVSMVECDGTAARRQDQRSHPSRGRIRRPALLSSTLCSWQTSAKEDKSKDDIEAKRLILTGSFQSISLGWVGGDEAKWIAASINQVLANVRGQPRTRYHA